MSDFFKKVTKSGLPVALTGKDEGAFFAGFVENADEEFLFMQAVYKKLRICICFIDDEPHGKMLQ